MEERPLVRAWRSALEERPWEPPEGWDAHLAGRRIRLVRQVVFTVVAGTALILVLFGFLRAKWGMAAFWTAYLLLMAARTLWPLTTAERRSRWEVDARRRSRTEHVLRSHVSVGGAFRDEVTERAEEIRSMSSVGLVAWPLLAVVCLAIATDADRGGERIVLGTCALMAMAALVVSQRRARWARRWLADPLPRP